MLCFNNLFALLTLLSTSFLSTATAQDVNYHVRSSFVLRSDVHMTLEEQLYAADCLQDSFNDVLKLDQVKMKQAYLKNFLRLPMLARKLDDAETDTVRAFKWIVDWNIQAADCPQCQTTIPNSLSSPELRDSWGASFCKSLQSGAFEIFHDVENCHILPYDKTETVGAATPTHALAEAAATAREFATSSSNQQIVFNARASLGLPHDEETTEEEQTFVDECLRKAYDETHDDDNIRMDSADLQQHFTVPHEKSSTTATATTTMLGATLAKPNKWMNMDFTYIWSYEVTGVCDLCYGGLLLAHGMEFEDGQVTLKGNKKEQERWEDGFCEKLRAGPYEKFTNVKSCYIVIYKDN
jgi:hypothetical protein